MKISIIKLKFYNKIILRIIKIYRTIKINKINNNKFFSK